MAEVEYTDNPGGWKGCFLWRGGSSAGTGGGWMSGYESDLTAARVLGGGGHVSARKQRVLMRSEPKTKGCDLGP